MCGRLGWYFLTTCCRLAFSSGGLDATDLCERMIATNSDIVEAARAAAAISLSSLGGGGNSGSGICGSNAAPSSADAPLTTISHLGAVASAFKVSACVNDLCALPVLQSTWSEVFSFHIARSRTLTLSLPRPSHGLILQHKSCLITKMRLGGWMT